MDAAVEDVTRGVGELSTNAKGNSNSDLVAATSGANKKPPIAAKKPVKKNSTEDLGEETNQPNAAELDYVGIVLNLRKEIQHLKGDLNEYRNTIDDIKQREKQVSALVNSIKQREEASLVDASPRVLLDRQKKQYQILIAKLRREVRRLKYQRNSLADPLLEVKYYPNLPRTATTAAARKSTAGLVGSAQDRLSDFFALNPPPQTGIRRRTEDLIVKSITGWDFDDSSMVSSRQSSRPVSASSQRYMKQLTNTKIDKDQQDHHNNESTSSGRPLSSSRRPQSSSSFSPPLPYKLGERVYAAVQGSVCLGTVRYIGQLVQDEASSRKSGKDDVWIGVRLERPIGYHDGIFKGKRFFQTEPNHGVFVRMDRVVPFKSNRADDADVIQQAAMYSRHLKTSADDSAGSIDMADKLINQVHHLEAVAR